MQRLRTLVLALQFAASYCNFVSYNGYKLINVNIHNNVELETLQSLEQQDKKVSYWNPPTRIGETVAVAVPPDHVHVFFEALNEFQLEFVVTQDNIGAAIEEEKHQNPSPSRTNIVNGFDLNSYHRHEEINQFLKDSVDRCNEIADLECKKIKIGHSYEGRKMLAIKIGKRGNKKQRAIWIDAGIHAREWIAPATAVWIMNKLITSYGTSNSTRKVVDAFDWYILPVHNPDGYEYTWTDDRFWRKTRSPNENSECVGTDPNRNWNHHWMEAGATDNPCDNIYGGSQPFSEIEVKNVAAFLLSPDINFEVYLSLHAYGQYWLTPWGYTDELPEDYDELVSLGESAAEAIKETHGRHYSVGSSTHLLYAAAGGSFDWVKKIAGIKYSFAMELRDRGEYGFVLPREQIKPTAKETYNGIRAMLELM